MSSDLTTFYQNGLPKNIDGKALIAILFFIKNRKAIRYFDFPLNKKTNQYEIPFYTPSIQNGFSLFCSHVEINLIKDYQKKKQEKYNEKEEEEKKKKEEEDIFKDPMPCAENFYCQICICKFENYAEHMKSKIHSVKIKGFEGHFRKIKLTLKKIRERVKVREKNIIKSQLVICDNGSWTFTGNIFNQKSNNHSQRINFDLFSLSTNSTNGFALMDNKENEIKNFLSEKNNFKKFKKNLKEFNHFKKKFQKKKSTSLHISEQDLIQTKDIIERAFDCCAKYLKVNKYIVTAVNKK